MGPPSVTIHEPQLTSPFVSVIIPVLKDLEVLAELLDRLRPTRDVELVVVAGEAPDAQMRDLHLRHPAVTWLESPPGRAIQMNRGARCAHGRWLLFLHADTRLAPGWLAELQRLDDEANCVGGSFRFELDSAAVMARVIERGVALRVRWLDLAYGDQALFVRRSVFERLDGYREMPLMEDVDLVRRMRQEGRLAHSRLAARVSARRWERDGWIRRSVENVTLVTLYGLGMSPDRLAGMYYTRPAPPTGPDAGPDDGGARGPVTPGGRNEIESTDSSGRTLDVAVVIPALNEAEAIGAVLAAIPRVVGTVVVADNGSTDDTADLARAGGATVVVEPRRGYGRACQAGLRVVPAADVIVFLDADLSDYPEDMVRLLEPVARGEADLVMGARGGADRPPHARLGTSSCVALINLLWGTRYTDLGPFRVITREALDRLDMRDETWGWTIEMQVKAAEAGLRVLEIPIGQRPRIGQSKISGTVSGTLRAGRRMMVIIASLWWTRRRRRRVSSPARLESHDR